MAATEQAFAVRAKSSGGGTSAKGRAFQWTCWCPHWQAEQAQHVPSDGRQEQQAKGTGTCIRSTSTQSVQTAQEGSVGPCQLLPEVGRESASGRKPVRQPAVVLCSSLRRDNSLFAPFITETQPAKPKARTPAAASLDEVEDRDDEDEEDEDEDDAGQAVQKSKRSKSGQTKRRRVAYISSDSEDEEDEEASAREQAEAEERLRQREAAAEEEERQAASALQDSRKRPIYSEDEDEDEESEEEQDDAQDGQRQDTAEPAQTEDAQGGTDGKRVIRKKRSRTFMNDKGFISTPASVDLFRYDG